MEGPLYQQLALLVLTKLLPSKHPHLGKNEITIFGFGFISVYNDGGQSIYMFWWCRVFWTW